MKIGVVGTGKLGMMFALTIESRGHEVKGYDVRPEPGEYLKARKIPFQEEHSAELLGHTSMKMVPLAELCEWADIIFMAPQTPHGPEFEGVTPLPLERADFDYSCLIECIKSVNANLVRPTVCALISTVLPGTLEREVLPLIEDYFKLVYTPQFIAMGTVYSDLLNPEFWLIGRSDPVAEYEVLDLFKTISVAPTIVTDLRTAESIKVFYNTFITMKTVLANTYGEMAHRLGLNVDDIFKAITVSTRRLLSPKYLQAGMGDGGGCHPRDNIALSWLARKCGMSYDLFGELMEARQAHCEFLANLIEKHCDPEYASMQNPCAFRLPVVILGRAFKPETNIETGSPSRLLSEILTRRGIQHECVEDFAAHKNRKPHLFFIGCKHARYDCYKFPLGSIVIDPFRYIRKREGITVIRIGDDQLAKHREEYRRETEAFA